MEEFWRSLAITLLWFTVLVYGVIGFEWLVLHILLG